MGTDKFILFHNVMKVSDGHIEEFKDAIEQAVNFVKKNGPQLMVEVFMDEDQMLCHSFQLYPDSDAILKHWQLSDPYIEAVMEHCSVQQLEVYGSPEPSIVDKLARAPFPVSFTPKLTGFTRI